MIESTLEPLFHITSLPKHWIIADVNSNFVITNANLEIESFSLYESICDADRLDFGRCNSARVTFTCLNIDLNLINKTFDISFTFEGHPNEPFNVGRFTVIEDKLSPDRKSREVVLQDALYFILNTNYADWYNALTWTNLTLGGFIDSFLTHVGLTADTASRAELVNASMPVAKTLETNELLGSTILYAVCQIAGCFGVINREGKFKFLYLKSDIEGLYPANDLYPAEDLYPVDPVGTLIEDNEYYPPLVYETYMTPQITKLHVAENTEDAGTTVGSGDSQYNIMGNFLLMGKSASDITTYCTNTLGAMTSRNYRPYSVSKMGNLCFEIGDPVRMSNDRMAVESYILTRTFTGTQGFIDDISAEGTQDYTTTANTASTSVQQLNSKTLKLKHDVDIVSSELTYQLDPTAGEPGGTHNSYAYQTAQEIGAKVETTTYNNFVDNTYATFVTQTDSALTAKAQKTVGNFTTGFSCTLDTTGHTWYKDNQQVMKIDGNGLAVTGNITGSTISGSSFYCGTYGNETTYIDSAGQEARFANGTTRFKDETNDGVREITSSLANYLLSITYWPNDNEATVSFGNSSTQLSAFDIINPDYFHINCFYGENDSRNLNVFHFNHDESKIEIGSLSNRTQMVDNTHIGGKRIDFWSTNNSNIYFNTKKLQDIIDDASNAKTIAERAETAANSAIQWGSASGIEKTDHNALALNAPGYSGNVHVGLSSTGRVSICRENQGLRIQGQDVQFYALTIGPTTYHLLGYT